MSVCISARLPSCLPACLPARLPARLHALASDYMSEYIHMTPVYVCGGQTSPQGTLLLCNISLTYTGHYRRGRVKLVSDNYVLTPSKGWRVLDKIKWIIKAGRCSSRRRRSTQCRCQSRCAAVHI